VIVGSQRWNQQHGHAQQTEDVNSGNPQQELDLASHSQIVARRIPLEQVFLWRTR